MKKILITIFVILLLGNILGISGIIAGDLETNMEPTFIQTSPEIISTDPYDNEQKVELDADITVEFSEPMNTGTVMYTCNPSPAGGFTAGWSIDNKNVTFSHTADFGKDTTYVFEITAGTDIDSNPLIAGAIPNPFDFKTIGNNPFITETTPVDGATGVALDADIIVEFSKPMNTASVTFESNPSPAGGFTSNWNTEGDMLIFSHTANFIKDQAYSFKITGGMDTSSNALVEGTIPNPWNFMTVSGRPVIHQTTPEDNAENVYLTADIVVKFSEPMDTSTVQFSCMPDPGGWSTVAWNALNDEVTYTHIKPFTKNTKYTCQITAGMDLDGLDLIPNVLNPWSFTTASDYPMIIKTTPVDGTINVSLDAEIVIEFSKSMDSTTVLYQFTPTVAGGFTADWNLGTTKVKFQHFADFAKHTLYTFTITAAKDEEGFDLISGNIPNPFVFTTIGDNPVIEETTPTDDATGVATDADIYVEFSKPMNTASVTYESNPSPASGYTSNWNAEGDILTFSHTANFIKDQAYSFEITGGKDSAGYDLAAGTIPNPFTFRTVGGEPVIFLTTPSNGEIDVNLNENVVIEFSESISIATVTYIITSAAGDPGGWSPTWSNSDKTLTLDHNKFATETKYRFEITAGQDLTGSALIAGPVLNPFEFTTGTEDIPTGPTSTLLSPADGTNVGSLTPTLTWEATDDSTEYYLYLSKDKAHVNSLATSVMIAGTSTSFTPANELEPETTYYWTVIPSDGTNLGTCESGVWSFTTPSKDISELTTTLLSPTDISNVDTLKPTLSWKGSDDAVKYYVYLSSDKAKVENHDSSVLIATLETNTYTPSNNLAHNTTYYWTVIPSDGTDNGTCNVWSFTSPSNGKASKDEEKAAIDWPLWIAIIVIIIIVIIILIVIIIIAFLMLKRKKKLPPREERRVSWNHQYR